MILVICFISHEKNYPEIKFIQVDAISSNTVFHWIDKEKQSLMLTCVYNALKDND